MSRHPVRDFYLSIDNTDPLVVAENDWLEYDWPDAPLPDPACPAQPGRAEGVTALACAIIGITFFGLVAFAACLAVL